MASDRDASKKWDRVLEKLRQLDELGIEAAKKKGCPPLARYLSIRAECLRRDPVGGLIEAHIRCINGPEERGGFIWSRNNEMLEHSLEQHAVECAYVFERTRDGKCNERGELALGWAKFHLDRAAA